MKDQEDNYTLVFVSGVEYFDEENEEIKYEFHIYSCDHLLEKMETETIGGGNLSIIFGKLKLTKQEALCYINAVGVPENYGIVIWEHVYYDEKKCQCIFRENMVSPSLMKNCGNETTHNTWPK